MHNALQSNYQHFLQSACPDAIIAPMEDGLNHNDPVFRKNQRSYRSASKLLKKRQDERILAIQVEMQSNYLRELQETLRAHGATLED